MNADDRDSIIWAASRCEVALRRGDFVGAAFWSRMAFAAVTA